MDDIIDSVETLNNAKTRTTNLETLLTKLKNSSFKIKKWIFSGGKGTEVCLANTEESEKVLELTWSLEKDVFEFKSKVVIKTKVSTKQYTNLNDLRVDPPVSLTRRQALSQLNSIFDPLGLATPFTVKAKVVMRTWEANRADDWVAACRMDYNFWRPFPNERCLFPLLYQIKKCGGKSSVSRLQRCIKRSFWCVCSSLVEIGGRISCIEFNFSYKQISSQTSNFYSSIGTLRAVIGSQDHMFSLRTFTI